MNKLCNLIFILTVWILLALIVTKYHQYNIDPETFRQNTKNNIHTYLPTGEQRNKTFQENILSCNCPELSTWHPGRVQHKLNCPEFRKLNPNLSVNDFLYKEGFSDMKLKDWPPIQQPMKTQNKNELLLINENDSVQYNLTEEESIFNSNYDPDDDSEDYSADDGSYDYSADDSADDSAYDSEDDLAADSADDDSADDSADDYSDDDSDDDSYNSIADSEESSVSKGCGCGNKIDKKLYEKILSPYSQDLDEDIYMDINVDIDEEE
jgi:hypothetical protein